MEKAKKIRNPQESGNLWMSALISGGIGLGAILIATLLLPLFFVKGDNPDALLMPMAVIAVGLGGFITGLISARRERGNELFAALTGGLVIFVPMLLISFLYKKGFSPLGFAVIFATIALSSLLGGMTVAKAGSNKKRSMKKIMKNGRT